MSLSSSPKHHQRSLSGLLRRKDSASTTTSASSTSSSSSSRPMTKRVPALPPAVQLPLVNHTIEINLPNIGWSVGSQVMTKTTSKTSTSPSLGSGSVYGSVSSSRSSISDYSDDSIVTPTSEHDDTHIEILEPFQHYTFPIDSFPLPPAVANEKLHQKPALKNITTSATSTPSSTSTSPTRQPKHSPSSSYPPIIQKRRPSLSFDINNSLNTAAHTLTPSSTPPPPRSNHNLGLGLMVTGSGCNSPSRSSSSSSQKSSLSLCWGTELGRRRGLVAARVPSRV